MPSEHKLIESESQEPQGAGRDVMRELEEKDPATLGEELDKKPEDTEKNGARRRSYYDTISHLYATSPKKLGEEFESSAMDAEANRVANEVRDERAQLKRARDSMHNAAAALEQLLRDGKVDPAISAENLAGVLSSSIDAIRKNPKLDQREEYENEIAACGALYTLMDEYGVDRGTQAGELVGVFKKQAEKLGEEFETKWGGEGDENG